MIIEETNPKAKVKDVYVIEFTRSRIFWSVVIGILILTFIFTFGYWTGTYNSKVVKTESLVGSKEDSLLKDIVDVEKKDSSNILDAKKGEANKEVSIDLSDVKKNDNQENIVSKQDSLSGLSQDKTSISGNKTLKDVKKEKVINKTKSIEDKKNMPKKGKFSIQLASFNSKSKALSLKEKLAKDGHKPYIIHSGNLYKVRIGDYSNYNEAANALSNLMKNLKIKDAYIIK